MFTESERDLLKISRALINLHGFFIVTKNNEIIDIEDIKEHNR